MKLIKAISLLFIWVLVQDVMAQPGTIGSYKTNSNLTRDLSGYQWKMKQMRPGEGVKAGLGNLPPEDIETLVWNPARVPGDVYTDLWKAGVIEDPYFGRNSVKAQWVAQNEWWYSTQFSVTEDLKGQKVKLEFETVDYSCEVWLNSKYLGRHEGAFSSFSFDVTEVIRTSEHWLESKNLLVVKLDPPPTVNYKVAGKKTPWFGDYWRDLIPFGITGPVRIVASGDIRIDDVFVNTELNKDGSADLDVQVTLENLSTSTKKFKYDGFIEGSNFDSEVTKVSIEGSVPVGKKTFTKKIRVDNPKLWWPWDLGKPNLYSLKSTIFSNDKFQDKSQFNFGIREVTMEWNPGFTKDEVSFPRTTLINGKNHFIRSACWGGPPDIFVGRTTPDKYRELIRLAKEANMNNIRIFGWHPPDIPLFYELCNEAGLTVWQDVIPLGTGNLSRDQGELEAIIQEAVAVIKDRRNHPSLIMIEGGEEAFLRASDPKFTRTFLEALGDTLHNYVNLPYVPDSPMTDEAAQRAGFKPKEAKHALGYFYSMGQWLMEDWYATLDYPIIPELAITSVPDVESLKKFIPKDELWTPGLSWGHHWADLDRLRMQNFDAFGDERTGSLEEFVEATQDAQGIIFQLSIEHLRRNKPRLSAIALCHFITYWPDMKWGFVDAYQQPKNSYNYVKTAYQPVLASLKFEKRRWLSDEEFKGELWIINDLYEEYENARLEVSVKDDNGKELMKKIIKSNMIKGNSAFKLSDISFAKLDQVEKYFYFDLRLKSKSGELLSSNNYMLLIGDQEAARTTFKEMSVKLHKYNQDFTYGNYYRFFPDVINEDGKSWSGDSEIPRARGFEKK